MDYDKYLYYIWLTGIRGVGSIISKMLLNELKTPEKIYNSKLEELLQIRGIGKETAKSILQSKDLSKAKNILKICKSKNINITVIDDDVFPESIKNCKDSPILFYYRGVLRKDLMGVAIVGARRCTEYAKKAAVEAADFLAKEDIAVISGLAKGIDSYAHTSCLKACGFTVAVLGCGVDICYPREHNELMNKIIEKGLVISEYSPSTPPRPEYFPKRNRIISALSNKVLIAEAGEKSGALITAEHAKRYNKEVYVVPGEIYSKSFHGSNGLISKGARIYLSPQQLLDKEIFANKKTIMNTTENNLEKEIVKILEERELTIDEISVKLSIDRCKLVEILFLLEIGGKLKNINGKYIIVD
ncbi:DNA-processing protein DprA [Clostridium sp.]|uniref:DNA-processing protein DprA n=1 Tax=Clostridium sp. TaxID=1506 RepID=UPI0039E9C9D3